MTAMPRRTLVTAACALALMTAGSASTAAVSYEGGTARAAASAAPPVRLPPDPKGLPAPRKLPKVVDDAAGYQPQIACVAKPMIGVVKLRALALATYGRGGTSPAAPRPCNSGSASEHKDGRAWDWMLSHANRADRRAAADFLSWVTGKGPSGEPGEMASRLGIMYVIYNRKIWASYSPGWRDYTGYDPHTSHIHISLSWNGARAHTSFWTGRIWAEDYGVCQVFDNQPGVVPSSKPRLEECPQPAAAPRTSSQSLAWLGSSSGPVSQAQELLGTPPSGSFDRATRKAVLRYQRATDLPRTGALDESTWASLLPSSRVLHVPDWTPAKAAAWAAKSGAPTIHRGDAGKAVYALQVALRLDDPVRNGYYGQTTRAAVIALKSAAGLPPTAFVNADVWNLLPAAPPS
jgi:hypothetical protein